MAPFEISAEQLIARSNMPLVSLKTTTQISRNANDTVLDEFISGNDRFTSTYSIGGFLTESVNRRNNTIVIYKYSIDTSQKLFESSRPFEFDATATNNEGLNIVTLHASVAFGNDTEIQLGGCTYSMKSFVITRDGVVAGKQSTTRVEILFSPDLRIPLHSHTEASDGRKVDYTVTGISTDLSPLQ